MDTDIEESAFSPCESQTTSRSQTPSLKSSTPAERSSFAGSWLKSNYEYAEGVSVARCALHSHYLKWCSEREEEPVNPASFGKIIRTNFPMLKTRRLGTRGSSKYHYYGIRPINAEDPFLKEQITFAERDNIKVRIATAKGRPANEANFSLETILGQKLPMNYRYQNSTQEESIQEEIQQPINSFSSSSASKEPVNNAFNFELYFQCLLQYTQILPAAVQSLQDVYLERLKVMLECYRLFCLNIVKFILNKDWLALGESSKGFWEQVSLEFDSIFALTEAQRAISIADEYTGMVLVDNLAGNTFSDEFRVASVSSFINYLESASNYHFPPALRSQKTFFHQKLASCLKRRLALNQLFHQAKAILSQRSLVSQLHKEWNSIDFSFFCASVTNTLGISNELVTHVQVGVACLLENKIPIERWIEWIKSLADSCIQQSYSSAICKTKDSCTRHFLQRWSFFMSQIMREFTLRHSNSFASFHLIRSFLDEAVLFYCEGMMEEENSTKPKEKAFTTPTKEHQLQKSAFTPTKPTTTSNVNATNKAGINSNCQSSSTLPHGSISVEDLNAHLVMPGNNELLQFNEEDLLEIAALDFSALQKAMSSPRKSFGPHSSVAATNANNSHHLQNWINPQHQQKNHHQKQQHYQQQNQQHSSANSSFLFS